MLRVRKGQPVAPALWRLVTVVQELSLTRDLDSIMAIVRRTARQLTGADGATFVLREGNMCYYADEDAIGPLWKGQRFPTQVCISGWAMQNRQPAVVEDIYRDPRIPLDAYRPTFVKSLVMVPIRTAEPIGAIGNYWARKHRPRAEEVQMLQALADTTSVAIENVQLYAGLEARVHERTAHLEATNRELEAFSSAVSHDLRAPLRSIDGFSQVLIEDYSSLLDEQGRHHLGRIRQAARRMARGIDALLTLSRTTQAAVSREIVDLSQIAREIMTDLQAVTPERRSELIVPNGIMAMGDPQLLRIALENLLSNAWKFTAKRRQARIEVGTMHKPDGQIVYFVQDNGVGFEMSQAGKLFGAFQRLHGDADFPGTGVGLATVQRIIHKHGGQVWAEAVKDQGATFFFTLADAQTSR
jgi:signal transduction histidine kinase